MWHANNGQQSIRHTCNPLRHARNISRKQNIDNHNTTTQHPNKTEQNLTESNNRNRHQKQNQPIIKHSRDQIKSRKHNTPTN